MTTSHVRPIMPTHATPCSLGNAAFKAQDYRKAIQHYTEVSATGMHHLTTRSLPEP